MNILVLVSGNGTNLQALIDAEREGRFAASGGRIAAAAADRPGVFALERAKKAGIPSFTGQCEKSLSGEERRRELSGCMLRIAREHNAGIIVLAGFLSILRGEIIQEYEGRIINIHPSLLPKYGGPGMYGTKVHEAVLAAGESESGCSVHIVDEGTDTGPVLLQRKVPVLPDDTPESLAERIHAEEHIAIVEALVMLLDER